VIETLTQTIMDITIPRIESGLIDVVI
jgi:hypothetical protein